ncbi:hypothetical protein A6U86_05530 [Rhizobium sp. AC27/96]|uniref:hypothetical protein n=1 Tax=Rhizobium sp. AC27/96 TaxID=1841653 RepID=UPI000827B6A7|nr:hypothetical protein [Rhizobium sp. AC27/96]OCJ12483.1 hypothetical protein A6U86_05530 [Rhizobium sp. AC27/96]
MTLAEFKAWFEGFTETLEAAPNEKQWERIKARVAEIDGVAVTKTVFVERYWDTYRRWNDYPMVWGSPVAACSSGQSAALGGGSVSFNAGKSNSSEDGLVGSPSILAMMDLGKAEYRSLDS